MQRFRAPRQTLTLGIVAFVLSSQWVSSTDEPTLTKEQIRQFLLTAEVTQSRDASKGITVTQRLTLSDGDITHDASFQSIDEHIARKQTAKGLEVGFVDSYKFNIAASALAEMLGIDDMLPVYVERKWHGNQGSLSWWLPAQMDEADRVKRRIAIPNSEAWNNQMHRIRVFDELVNDTDSNLTNVLIGENWKLWRIDFTRAFRLSKDLRHPNDLVRCDRQLLGRLKTLDGDVLAEKTKHYLSKDEVQAVMARRDKIVARFQQLIAEKGEHEVLY